MWNLAYLVPPWRVAHAVVSPVTELKLFPDSLLDVANFQVGMHSTFDSVGSETTDGKLTLFPLVQDLRSGGGCCAYVATTVKVIESPSSTKASSARLQRALVRAQHKLRGLTLANTNISEGLHHWPVELVSVHLAGTVDLTETLDEDTKYHYTMTCAAVTQDCKISASSVYAAISALESTLLQVFAGGKAPFQDLQITDWPDYQVRGLMVDVGRRFVPKDVIREQIINGMALVRMNFLQLHLSDFCRFALALPNFPELTRTGLLNGQYTVDDIHEIVTYARDRGIRVVPEVDLPGHANGLLPLKSRGLHFCEPTKGSNTLPEEAAKVFDDPGGQSRKVLEKLLLETAAAFGNESWFHVGGDEVSPSGHCTQDNVVQLEEFIVRDIVGGTLGRTAVAWGDVLLKQKRLEGERAAGNTNGTVLVAWNGSRDVREVLKRGHRVIAASIEHHYLDTDSVGRPSSRFWYDLMTEYDISPSDRVRILGGISAMWTDRYCHAYQCGAAGLDIAKRLGSHSIPAVPMMFLRDYDKVFARSLSGMIWPRAGVTAAALWRYSSEFSKGELERRSAWLAELLHSVGHVATCPPGCTCDERSSCGKPYALEKSDIS